MTIYGFTGTRHGMLPDQAEQVSKVLVDGETLLHGDCVGADAEAHCLGRLLGLHIIAHPPKDEKLRAYCAADEIREPCEYLDRNHHIVDECDIMVAAPAEMTPTKRGGTWSTIRYALKQGKTLIIVLPDGTTTEELP